MKRMKTLPHQISLHSLIPGLFGLGILTIQTIFHFIDDKEIVPFNKNFDLTPGSNEANLESRNLILLGLSQATKAASEISSNYFIFIGVLLCLDALIQISTAFKDSRNRKGPSFKNPHLLAASNIPLARTALKKIVVYSLMYFIYQAIIFSSAHQKKVPGDFGFPLKHLQQQPARILTEKTTSLAVIDSPNQAPISNKKPSLSIGRIIGSLKLDIISIFLSSDNKTAFLLTRFSGKLKVVDISSLESPLILSSLTLNRGGKYLNYKSIIPSLDETKLYISNVDFLEVIDVTDLRNPVSVKVIEDKTISASLKPDEKYPEVCKPTLLISEDNQVLYVGGLGLQIFDISNPVNPALISSIPSMMISGILMPSSLQMSEDKKLLYYSDGGLHVYELLNPRKPNEIRNTFSHQSPITSMLLSYDEKTIFVLTQEENDEIVLQKLEVQSLTRKGSSPLKLPQKSSWPPLFLPETQNDVFLFMHVSQSDSQIGRKLLVLDIEEERFLFNNKTLVEDAFDIWFSPDYRNVFVASEGKFNIVELYLDFAKKVAFSENSSIIGSFDMNSTLKSFIVDEEILYGLSFEGQFEIYQRRAGDSNVKLLSSYPAAGIERMLISNQKAYVIVENKKIWTLDISNLEEPRKLDEFGMSDNSKNIIGFLLSAHGNTGYRVAKSAASTTSLDIIDFTDSTNPVLKASVYLPKDHFLKTKILLSKDQKTLFLIADQILVYDVSNPSKPLSQGSAIVDDGVEIDYFDAILSHDEETLFVKFGPKNRHIKVHCFNVSNKTASPKILSEMALTSSETNENNIAQTLRISPDSKKIYIARNQYLLVLDVTSPSNPALLGTIRTLGSGEITNFDLSPDGKTGYISAGKKVHMISMEQPVNTVFLKEERALLGEKYSMEVMILKLDSRRDYGALEEEYKFTKFGLVEINLLRNAKLPELAFRMAPSWMTFDLETKTLAIESKRRAEIGTYRVYFVYSTRIPKDVFNENKALNKTYKSEDLLAMLISMGYVDNQLFLTKNFGDYGNFILNSQYSEIQEEIYHVLEKYSFETFNLIEIVPSLSLDVSKDKLAIKTSSTNSLKIDVNLDCNNQAQFLYKNYATLVPTIEEKKSRLILEGSLKEINQALEEIVINLKHEQEECNGVITLNDKLNPPVIESVKNILHFFSHNQAPWLDESFPNALQSQVNAVTVYTGQYFQIQVNQSTWRDNYTSSDKLNYRLVMVNKDDLETTIPSWLYFNNLTMMGTAPEIVFGRDIELVLVVANEFRELREPFVLHVNISSSFALKLLIKFSPYILSIVGLIISANKIYNILAKKRYRHPKEFHIKVGEEITSEVIFPVSFVGEEVSQAKRILKFLEKKRGKFEEEKLDKKTIEQIIKEEIEKLRGREREKLGIDYDVFENKINQIIWNELVSRKLKSSGEKKTMKIFEEIKDEWHELVEWDLDKSCFRINEEKWKRELELRKPGKVDEERNLIEYNEELLRDAILGYAFQSHNINEVHLRVQIKCMEKMKRKNFMKKFLKLDLKELTCTDKGKVGYGIGFLKKGHTLSFSGVVEEEIKGKTLVIQFTNLKQKILKELWIYHGVGVEKKFAIEKGSKDCKIQEKGYEAL